MPHLSKTRQEKQQERNQMRNLQFKLKKESIDEKEGKIAEIHYQISEEERKRIDAANSNFHLRDKNHKLYFSNMMREKHGKETDLKITMLGGENDSLKKTLGSCRKEISTFENAILGLEWNNNYLKIIILILLMIILFFIFFWIFK